MGVMTMVTMLSFLQGDITNIVNLGVIQHSTIFI